MSTCRTITADITITTITGKHHRARRPNDFIASHRRHHRRRRRHRLSRVFVSFPFRGLRAVVTRINRKNKIHKK